MTMDLHRRRDILRIGAALVVTAAIPRGACAEVVSLTIETSFGPRVPAPMRAQLQDWADALRPKIAVWWPTMNAALSSPGFMPTTRLTLAFYRIDNPGVPAATDASKSTIYIDPWKLIVRLNNPDAQGMVAHELVHVAQTYPQGATPGWITEGIADYMRYYVLLPDDPGRFFNPQGLSEKTGYQPAAGLLDWIEVRHPGAVRRINAAMRGGGDGAATLAEIGGGDPDALWRAYMATNPPAANAEAAARRAAAIRS